MCWNMGAGHRAFLSILLKLRHHTHPHQLCPPALPALPLALLVGRPGSGAQAWFWALPPADREGPGPGRGADAQSNVRIQQQWAA